MAFVSRIAPNRFKVRFAEAPSRDLMSSLVRRWKGSDAVVDPYRMGLALLEVIRGCELRAANGAPMAWNEFRFFLAASDYDAIRAVMRRTHAGLDTVIRKELDRLKAETVGQPIIRIGFDESRDVPDGEGVIIVEFKEDRELGPDDDHEITIRVGPRAAGKPAASAAPPAPGPTVASPPAAGPAPMSAGSTLRLRWAGQHEALILPGTVVRIGRPHPGAPPDFIGLTGAPEVVNRVMLVVDNTSETVILTRLPDANAVHVGAMLVQPGGRQSPTLPARLTLANNGLELTLERVV